MRIPLASSPAMQKGQNPVLPGFNQSVRHTIRVTLQKQQPDIPYLKFIATHLRGLFQENEGLHRDEF